MTDLVALEIYAILSEIACDWTNVDKVMEDMLKLHDFRDLPEVIIELCDQGLVEFSIADDGTLYQMRANTGTLCIKGRYYMNLFFKISLVAFPCDLTTFPYHFEPRPRHVSKSLLRIVKQALFVTQNQNLLNL
jgi:hypothetical protein